MRAAMPIAVDPHRHANPSATVTSLRRNRRELGGVATSTQVLNW
jgi:hypothetical protein